MATHSTWQSDLTFCDRLESVVNITAAQQSHDPSIGYSQAQSEARSLETHNLSVAQSKEEYHKLCDETVRKLLAGKQDKGSSKQDQETPDESLDGIDVGSYTNAKHYRDGLVSTLYKAMSRTGKSVALKITTPSIVTPPHDSEKEARVLRTVSNANIIPLLEHFQESGSRLILAFPFMPHDLENLLGQHFLTLEQVRCHLRDVFNALACLHSLDIIHRDVKSSNILLASPSGPAYLADFGIAWVPNDRGSEPVDRKITDVGTSCYRPPELLFGNTKYNTSLDLWAMGCVVAEAVRLDSKKLFSSGPAGSELALIQSIFSTLGTPDLEVWPEAEHLPDWGKMQFRKYPAKPWNEILEKVPKSGQDLASKLVRYESGHRLTAATALAHPLFNEETFG